MSESVTFASLPPERQQLLKRMQQANFGRFESLVVRNGQPVFDPSPLLIREVKFGGENGWRSEAEIGDFVLKSQVVELLRFLDQLRDGVIESLEIKHGLPFRMLVREEVA